MNNIMRYFKGSIAFTVVALALAFFVGYEASGEVAAGMSTMVTAAMLGVLETSLSFDNAVVNATVLETMSHFWRRMFLTIGILIAVFGMRILFPIIIVWSVSDLSLPTVLSMVVSAPSQFQQILIDQHVLVAGFGGAFLWMVFTKFFFDAEKEHHWISWLELPMQKIGKIEAVWVGVTMVISYLFARVAHGALGPAFLASAMLGIITYIVVDGISGALEEGEGAMLARGSIEKTGTAGLAAFMYLEVLDASFSFDGVIGSFAITNNLFIIGLGLGIGAMFVRSLTVKLVEDKTLSTYAYLEHGAFWAIGALSLIMYLGVIEVEVPEVVSGLIGIVFIGLSFISSVRHNRREAAQEQNDTDKVTPSIAL